MPTIGSPRFSLTLARMSLPWLASNCWLYRSRRVMKDGILHRHEEGDDKGHDHDGPWTHPYIPHIADRLHLDRLYPDYDEQGSDDPE